jgi:hypothetical protein
MHQAWTETTPITGQNISLLVIISEVGVGDVIHIIRQKKACRLSVDFTQIDHIYQIPYFVKSFA